MTERATEVVRGCMFIVSAPSGGGKTSLTRQAVERLRALQLRVELSVSYTTRKARPGEQDGTHYHFVDEGRFAAMLDGGEFLEHADVFGRRYGTGRQRTEAMLEQGCDLILDIDWQGARQVRALVPEAVSIFILPPSLEELERRLRTRAQDDDATVNRRMAAARAEMSHYAEYDYLIINDDFERAMQQLMSLFLARRLSRPLQSARYAGLIDSLLR